MLLEPESDSSGKWLEYANSDLALASIIPPPGVLYELLCFHAQQSAEKVIKSILIHYGIDFPYSHNLQKLIELLPSPLQALPTVIQAVTLSPYAVLTRYPGEIEPVTEDEYNEAVNIALEVVKLAESEIRH